MSSSAPMERNFKCWEQPNAITKWKHGTNEEIALKGVYADCVICEYIWIDADGETRSKARTLAKRPTSAEDVPVWNFDGASTDQAPKWDDPRTTNSDIHLIPRRLFSDPFRQGPHVMVLAEAVTPELQPAPGNHRSNAAQVGERYEHLEPWFGLEQEYILMHQDPNAGWKATEHPLAFHGEEEPAQRGQFYGGVGKDIAIGRELAEHHLCCCLYAGVKISGANAEYMPGQWEFQVGPGPLLEIADHLHIARYILNRVSEWHKDIQVCYLPKPIQGEHWDGNGCHINFSTKETRTPPEGLDVMQLMVQIFTDLRADEAKHMAVYGEGNEKRLIGELRTGKPEEFKYGIANRYASFRIPLETAAKKAGYFEDRRPGGNIDPYRAMPSLLESVGDIIDADAHLRKEQAAEKAKKKDDDENE